MPLSGSSPPPATALREAATDLFGADLAEKRCDGGHSCSLLAQVFPSTFVFISGRSIPAAVWLAAHLLLQHAQAGFLLGHGPGPLDHWVEAGWLVVKSTQNTRTRLPWPHLLASLGRMQKAKRPSAIIEAVQHSLNLWCGLSNVVRNARTVWTRYRRLLDATRPFLFRTYGPKEFRFQ